MVTIKEEPMDEAGQNNTHKESSAVSCLECVIVF